MTADKAREKVDQTVRSLLMLPGYGIDKMLDTKMENLVDAFQEMCEEMANDRLDREFNRGDYRY